MIKRIWHGWTTSAAADRYETLLKAEILPGIAAKDMDGYRGIEVLRRTRAEAEEVEFVTIMTFESRAAIEQFVGEDATVAHVPAAAREVLTRWDDRSQHYEVRESLDY